MESLHRSACDECHDRKIKCSTSGPGACLNCQGTGRVCTFSPRDEMGRPRKTGRRAKDRSTADGKTSSKSAAQKRSSVSDKKEEQRPLTPSRSCSQNDLGALPQPAQHDTFHLADNDFDMMSQNDFTFILENQANFSSSASHSYSPSHDSSMNYFQHHNQVPRQEQLLLTPPISEHSKAADKSLNFLSHTDGSALSPDVYRQLSRLLFTLRQEYNRPWSVPGMFGTEDYTARPGKEIFESASSLCDILHAVITGKSTENEPIRPPQHPMDHEDTHGVFVLALMGVAMLLDIYRLLGRTHSWAASPNPDYTDLSVTGQTPGAAGTGSASISSMLHHHMDPSGGSMGAGRSFTANHLTSILQLTTMDFHLARLASMLGDVSCGRDSAIGMQRVVKPLGGLEVADLLMEIKRTREEMRGSAESLLVKA